MYKILICLLRRALSRPAHRCKSIYFQFSNGTTTHKAKHMQTTISEKMKFSLTVALVSAAGNPVQPAALPTWASSDESVATVVPAVDGLSAEVLSTGVPGTASITASVDGLTATDEVTVSAGPAVTLTLIAGAPEPIVTAPVPTLDAAIEPPN